MTVTTESDKPQYTALYQSQKTTIVLIEGRYGPMPVEGWIVTQAFPPFDDWNDMRQFASLQDAEHDYTARIPVRNRSKS